jgi:hypothetical protein
MRRSGAKPQFVLFSVGLTPHQKAALTALSARARLAQTVLVRAGVDLVLAEPDLAVAEDLWDSSIQRFEIFTARVTRDQRRALAALARRRGVSRAALTRAGIDQILAQPELITKVWP